MRIVLTTRDSINWAVSSAESTSLHFLFDDAVLEQLLAGLRTSLIALCVQRAHL